MGACSALWSVKVSFFPLLSAVETWAFLLPMQHLAWSVACHKPPRCICYTVHIAGNADLAVDSCIIVLSNKKGEKVFCTRTSKFPSWILQIAFTVGIPCFQSDRRQSRYLISLSFRPPICKNSLEEFWKLKSKESVRLLGLVLGFLFCKT